MALFVITKMEMAQEIGDEVGCATGETRMFVDLKDNIGGGTARVRVCLPLNEADVRDKLAPLVTLGYTPNDWD